MTRWLAGLFAAIAVAVGAIGLGRWEERRAAAAELSGMRHVLGLVGGAVDSKRLTGYRVGPPACFTYHIGRNPLGAQLCFDEEGRLVEAVDRLEGEARYWSLTYRPQLSPIRIAPGDLERLLESLDARS